MSDDPYTLNLESRLIDLQNQCLAMELQNSALKDQIVHLEELLKHSNTNVMHPSEVLSDLYVGSDAEVAAQTELRRLKQISFERDLTKDECTKLDICNKVVLTQQQARKNSPPALSKDIPSETLLTLVQSK